MNDRGEDISGDRPGDGRASRRRGKGRAKPPLDAVSLKDLALFYLSRYAVSRQKLLRYLDRKIGERGWAGDGSADLHALADRLEQLGYLDDEAYAAMRAGSLSRRGYGQRRIRQDLHHGGIEPDMVERLTQGTDIDGGAHLPSGALGGDSHIDHVTAALTLARRRKIGPFGTGGMDEKERQRQIGVLVRAGHSFALARHIVDQPAGADIEAITENAPTV